MTPYRERPDYLSNTRVWRVEREQETSSGFFYDGTTAATGEQVSLYAKGMRVDPKPTRPPHTGSNGTAPHGDSI